MTITINDRTNLDSGQNTYTAPNVSLTTTPAQWAKVSETTWPTTYETNTSYYRFAFTSYIYNKSQLNNKLIRLVIETADSSIKLEFNASYFSSPANILDSLQSTFVYDMSDTIIFELTNKNVSNITVLRISKNNATESLIDAFKGATLTILTQDIITN